MKPFVLVVGGRNSGKSTVIVSLTGQGSRSSGPGVVMDHSTGRKLYVIVSSPQESPSNELTPQRFGQILSTVTNNDNIVGLVMAVQPTNPHVKLSLAQIIGGAQRRGVFACHAFVLDPPYPRGSAVDIADVRSRLAAHGVSTHFLDGRRFAFLNALEIKTITGIP